MLRSLFSGVSGLRAHQEMMDIVGNNIANVNTTGFKSSSAVFQDVLSQTMSGAGAPTAVQGGTDPAQIGLGVRVAAVTTNWTQGSLQVTGRSTDLAIQGDGFFVTSSNGQQEYTRAGNFQFDANGSLTTQDGAFVQGWSADPITHQINTSGPTGNLTMPPGQLLAPVQTQNLKIGNMLSADAAVGATVTTSIPTYNSQGQADNISITFTKTAADSWTADAKDANGTDLGSAAITFDPATGLMNSESALDPATGLPFSPNVTTWKISPQPAADWPNPITVSFGNAATDTSALKEFGGTTTVQALSQDGSPAGTLQSFTIANDGTVSGVFSNGRSITVGQVAMATFNNPSGLSKGGGSEYLQTPDSGLPQIGTAGTGGRGTLASGSLEMSNVDLGQEFTNLIIAQRGFEANSKVVTSSDQLLQSLLSMKQ